MAGKKQAQKIPTTKRAIDQVRAGVARRRRKIVVKQWENLELWFGPLTQDDMDAVNDRLRAEGLKEPEDDIRQESRRRILLVIHKAETKDGKKAFQFGDEHYLRTEADYLVLQTVIAFMYESAISLPEAEKGSGATRS